MQVAATACRWLKMGAKICMMRRLELKRALKYLRCRQLKRDAEISEMRLRWDIDKSIVQTAAIGH